jgi:hypothetical protein
MAPSSTFPGIEFRHIFFNKCRFNLITIPVSFYSPIFGIIGGLFSVQQFRIRGFWFVVLEGFIRNK